MRKKLKLFAISLTMKRFTTTMTTYKSCATWASCEDEGTALGRAIVRAQEEWPDFEMVTYAVVEIPVSKFALSKIEAVAA